MANGIEDIRDEYAQRVDAGGLTRLFEPPVYGPMENPDDPEGPPLEGPHRDDLRGIQVVRTEDRRLPREGVEVDTPVVRFLFLPPPPETPPPVNLGS